VNGDGVRARAALARDQRGVDRAVGLEAAGVGLDPVHVDRALGGRVGLDPARAVRLLPSALHRGPGCGARCGENGGANARRGRGADLKRLAVGAERRA
jgi:hypothetical protein